MVLGKASQARSLLSLFCHFLDSFLGFWVFRFLPAPMIFGLAFPGEGEERGRDTLWVFSTLFSGYLIGGWDVDYLVSYSWIIGREYRYVSV